MKKIGAMGLPASLANLSKLTHLNLAKNNLRLFPSVVTKLPNLSQLDLSENPIQRITKSVGKMTNLKKLNLKGSNIDKDDRENIKALLPQCKISF